MTEGKSNSLGVKKGEDEYYFSIMDMPPGFRFHPTDEEIITHYLTHKVMNSTFTARAIGEVDLNKCEPWDLPKKAKLGEKEWYFFCQRDRKYPTGMRTNRATESGYWKATGKDKEIYKGKERRLLVGMKKTLVFYKGRAPKGEKTNWVMHEYRLQANFSNYYDLPRLTKDEWVVCRIFHKSTGIKRSPITDAGGGPSLTRMNFFGYDADADAAAAADDDDHDDGRFLLDCPWLPPLMDPSEYPFSINERPALAAGSSFNTDIGEEDEINGTAAILKAHNSSSSAAARSSDHHGDYNYLSHFSTNLNDHQLHENQQEDRKIDHFIIMSQSNRNYTTTGTGTTNYQAYPINQPTSPADSYDPVFPFQAPNLGYLHREQEQRIAIIGEKNIPSFTAGGGGGGSSSLKQQQQQVVTGLSKMGQFSSNQSMVSVSQDTVTTDLTVETSSAMSTKKHMGSNTSYEDDIEDPSIGVGPISDLDDYLWNY